MRLFAKDDICTTFHLSATCSLYTEQNLNVGINTGLLSTHLEKLEFPNNINGLNTLKGSTRVFFRISNMGVCQPNLGGPFLPFPSLLPLGV